MRKISIEKARHELRAYKRKMTKKIVLQIHQVVIQTMDNASVLIKEAKTESEKQYWEGYWTGVNAIRVDALLQVLEDLEILKEAGYK